MTKTLRNELSAKPLFISTGIAERIDPGLIARIWLGWAKYRIDHGRGDWLYPVVTVDDGISIWILDEGDHATMVLPEETRSRAGVVMAAGTVEEWLPVQ